MDESQDARVRIELLGGFRVHVAGAPVPDAVWRLRRAKTLLKLLALAPERRLHREAVVEALWPGGAAGAGSLHQVMYAARRAIAAGDDDGDRLVLRDDVVALAPHGVWVDVDAFERAAETARSSDSQQAYQDALALYGGGLLPEDRYEAWAAPRREALHETQLALLLELAELQSAAGDVAGGVETLRRAIVENPLHEPAHRALMRRLAQLGRRQDALAQYHQLRHALRRELAADPDPETRAVYQEILAAQHETTPRREEQGAPPRADRGTATRFTLPHQLTSFVGRERELDELEAMIGRTRLLTLTGPGGAGKTRLALELAARQAPAFDQAVGLVELAPIGDPALVSQQTATALGMELRSEHDPIEALALGLADQRLLLVLDNCEHLVDACAELADRLLRACPELQVLATSRERLRVAGEVAWRVPPLSLPGAGDAGRSTNLEGSEAIRLFAQRAADAAPGFAVDDGNAQAVAAICRRLDGMPLALELAAARTAALSPAQIADRLGDALDLLRAGARTGLTRQQTLRATLDWSHGLLGERERVLYRRLGVFAGTFGVDAVEGVCTGAGVDRADVVDLLARLVDKSLVQVETGTERYRYRLLDTVRQHAREHLRESGEWDRLVAAHRAWYLALAESADRDADPAVATAWPIERLEAEHDDLRAALGSAIAHEPQIALRLACALWWFWMARGLFVEAARWLHDVTDASREPSPTRARALFALAAVTVRLGHGTTDRMLALAGEAVGITRACDDRDAEARALERLGVLAMGGFDFPSADRAFARGLALAEEVGDGPVAVAIRQGQAVLAGCRGHNAQARELLQQSLALLAEIPDRHGPVFWAAHINPVVLRAGPGGTPRAFFEDTFLLLRAVCSRAASGYLLCNVAETWRSDGDYAAAREALEQALALFGELGDDQGTAVILNALGNLARQTGDFDGGRAWFTQALALRRATRDRREIAMTLLGAGLLELYAGDRATGSALVDDAHAIFTRTEDGPGLQLLPLNLGGFALDAGDPERAAALLERSARIARRQGFVRSRGWASCELAEATIATGDEDRAREAIAEARSVFAVFGETRGSRYADELERRLAAR